METYSRDFITSGIESMQRAWQYGDGFFDTLLWANGQIVLEEYHQKRFNETARLLQIIFPDDGWQRLMQYVRISVPPKTKWAAVRITCYRSGAGKYTPESNQGEAVVEVTPLQDTLFKFNKIGLTLGVCTVWQKPSHPLSNIKSLSAAGQVLASIERKQKGVDELFVCNVSGRVSECIASNIFIVRKGILYTPPLIEGALMGTLRGFIIDHAEGWGYSVLEKPFSIADITGADEIFLTNALRGIRWVLRFENTRYFNKLTKELSHRLNFEIMPNII